MSFEEIAPWAVLLCYVAVTWWATPRAVGPQGFFEGRDQKGAQPSILLVAFSAAISWVFAKSIANASDLAKSYGIFGSIGYTTYYASFIVAGITIYLLRTRGGYRSIPDFLTRKYGRICARLFLFVVVLRLINEVWSNTKVMALYFGSEGSSHYWTAVVLVTAFTVSYAWSGGLRASLLTDRVQTLIAIVLLGLVLAIILPDLGTHGISPVPPPMETAGLTFCGLAAVQVFSYPFHDPVLTDRGFLTSPGRTLAGFLLAGALSGGFIFLFSLVGLYGREFGLHGPAYVAVPEAFGLAILMIFNGLMLLSGGSTLDSTFTSTSKLTSIDWEGGIRVPAASQMRVGRVSILAIAVIGNLPLLSVYLGDRIGPAIIAATTISGTMVMGLAPIFLLAWVPSAGRLGFHLAFWPGLVLGGLTAVETFSKTRILPAGLALGSGPFATDLGVNVFGLLLCTTGFLAGAAMTAAVRKLSPALLQPEQSGRDEARLD